MQPNDTQLNNSDKTSKGGPITVSLVKPAIVPDEFYAIWQKYLADGLNVKRARKAAIAEYKQIRPDFVAAEVPVKIEGVLTIKELLMRLPVDKPIDQALFDMGFDQAEINLLRPVIESRVEYQMLPPKTEQQLREDITESVEQIEQSVSEDTGPEQDTSEEPETVPEQQNKPVDNRKLRAEYNALKKRYFRKDGLMKKNISKQVRDRLEYLRVLLTK